MNLTVAQPRLILPPHPVLAPGHRLSAWLSPDGEIETIPSGEAADRLRSGTLPIVCHAKSVARRLGTPPFQAFDVLELYAFVRPARFALPTPKGLAQALGLALPGTLESEAECLLAATGALLAELAESGDPEALPIARAMAEGGWPWGEAVIAALGEVEGSDDSRSRKAAGRGYGDGLRILHRLQEWQERPPEAPPGNQPLVEQETLDRLSELLGSSAEKRQEQKDYAAAATAAFQPRGKQDEPRLVLAEAGTGVGKTLGYIAPASVWAEKNDGAVWISTYTRNLQRQLDGELDRLFPDGLEKAERVVIRKGRENYFCLLNFEEALSSTLGGAGLNNATTALGLMARWALRTRDGDMIGGDFPSWLKDLLGPAMTTELTDTRGECIYSACAHYGRCFIEHTVRRARAADIVVANHALVMITAALGGVEEAGAPTRYVFDEGHHLFDAADGAFSAHLTGRETAELRRWLIGAEEGSRSRSRGLRNRISDLIDGDGKATKALEDALKAVRALPSGAWNARLSGGRPEGVAEVFFSFVRGQVYARDGNGNTPYSLETETAPGVDGLADAAAALGKALSHLAKPLGTLIAALGAKLDAEADDLDTATRNRIEAIVRSLDRRGRMQVHAWRQMLDALRAETPEDFIDWFQVDRMDGRDFDIGMHRHWIDPTRPFAETVVTPAQGVLITSATLRDCTGDKETDWVAAERRTGAFYVANPPDLSLEPSPFDYAAHTRVLVIGDVERNDPDQVAAAYRELFLAAGGGALGLFTAISRLRSVYQRILSPMDEAGLSLLAQHMDVLDTGTLVDIFRAEENSCLLGTDAVRDGVDVPGRSLRLIVFDRVPWPRPDILHKQRRKVFGGRTYDEMLARMKLKQAYGRLIRRSDDRGVFVMLDKALPSRLLGAFPDGVEVKRLGLKEAIAVTGAFLAEPS